MSPLAVGIIGIIVVLLLFFMRIPIAFSMMLVGFVGYSIMVSFESGVSILGRIPTITAASYDLSQIPLFVLMGFIVLYSGSGSDLYTAMQKWLGRLPGGLAMATIGSSAAFASVCGSSTATAATIGTVSIPEMKRYNYEPSLASASAAAGGTIGIMIPPSVILIIYAMLTEQSVGKLFMAGVLPGLLIMLVFMLTIYILTRRNPRLAPPAPTGYSFREKLQSINNVWSVVGLFLIVIVGIYTGFFTPTEAGSVGCLVALLIALGRKRLTRQDFITAVMETVKFTGLAFIILISAYIFGYFLAVTKIPMELARLVTGLPLPNHLVMIGIFFLIVAMGCFMDSMALVILMVPILYPVVLTLGFDPIWFGIMVVLLTETGLLTPPVGINVYVICGIAPDIPMYTIFRGIIPFVVALIVCAGLLLAFPQIALFLPKTM